MSSSGSGRWRRLMRPDAAFCLLAEQVDFAVLAADEEEVITYANPAAARLFAATDDLAGQTLDVLIPERLRAAHHTGVARHLALAGGVTRQMQVSGRRGDGTEVEILLTVASWSVEGHVMFTAMARPAMPEGLDLSAGMKALLEASAAAAFLVQGETIQYANPAAASLTGLSQERLRGLPSWEPVHPEFRASFRFREEARLRGGSFPARHEVRLQRPDGQERWADLTTATVELDGQTAALTVAIDVSEQRLAEHALRESERRMRDILENVQLIALMRDTEGEVTFANPFFLELVGAEEEDVVGRNWFESFLPLEQAEARRDAYRAAIQASAVPRHEESEVVTRDGERRVISWNHTLLHDLAGAVVGTASMGSDVTDRKRVEEQLVHDAFHDPLTALPNRALFLHHLSSAFARARRRPDRLLAVLFLDLDRFKLVNDSLGHAVGDQLLADVSRLLRNAARAGDVVARLGGDEFAILLEDLDEAREAHEVAERIHTLVAKPFDLGGHEVFASLSIGIALSARDYLRAEDLLRDADTAMYQAKQEGRSCIRLFDTSMHSRAMHQLALESDLRRAVERSSFILHYQPIVNLADRRIAGVEALIRWEHSERGLVSPTEFVHLAEETGLIFEIGRWALQQACLDMRRWIDTYSAELELSVNISSRQFSQPNLVDQVAFALRESGLPASRLKLEITESVIMENAESALSLLMRIKELGVRVSIDDFGTGYSSLGYLLRFPADSLKIDRSFVSSLHKGKRNVQVVEAIISLGRGLGMDVVAEGIETEEQRTQLLAINCRLGQGFLFSRPVDGARVEALLARQASQGASGPLLP